MKKSADDSYLKNHGILDCSSRNHLKEESVSKSENEAIEKGSCPCKHCSKEDHVKFALYLRLPLR